MADQVEEVKSKTDIVSIVGEHVELKKAGRNFKALCPFHSEKTPSFIVSPELQIYKCFGCGESGDAISFLEQYEGMEFYEALKFLADRAGVKLKPLSGGYKSEREKLYQINTLANHFYSYLLLKHSVGKTALNYLLKERGLKIDTIKTFKLGYSPNTPLALRKYLVEKKKIAIAELERVGIVSKYGRGPVDRFRGRVIFPLFDHRGNISGFAGRIIPGAKKELAKYINSPETKIYHKSKLLYGLNLTRSQIKKKKFAVVVEGELDMISSWQSGVKNTVAIKGSALTQEQVKLLSRYCQKIVMALDADSAGDDAARRGIEIAEREGFDIRIARLGKYKDPDDMARRNPKALKDSIKNAVGIWDFIINYVFSKHKKTGGAAKAALSRELVPVLSSIKDKIVQAHYVELVAKKLGVPTDAVVKQVETKGEVKKVKPSEVIAVQEETKTRRELLEERLLSVGFRFDPTLLPKREFKSLVKGPLCSRILEELGTYLKKNKQFDPSIFASKLPKELVDGFTEMVLKDIEDIDEEKPKTLEHELEVIKKELKTAEVKTELEKVAEKIQALEEKKEKIKLKKEQERFGKLTEKLHKLEE
jgi:DNA primase